MTLQAESRIMEPELRYNEDFETLGAAIVPIEVLLSSPIISKSNKVSIFLEKCHDDTKEHKNKDKIMKRVNDSAKKCKIWPTDKTWKDVIDEKEERKSEKEHFKILSTFIKPDGSTRKNPMIVDPNLVSDLIGVIRNKYSHRNLLGDERLKKLGWDMVVSGKVEFCEQKFVTYWSSRFPKLLPFLWEHYKEHVCEKNPGGAYPSFFKSQFSSCNLYDPMATFGQKLSIALKLNFQQGWVEDRNTFGNDDKMTLEFRLLDTCYLDVNKNSFLEIDISKTQGNHKLEEVIDCNWYEITNDKIKCETKSTILTYDYIDSSVQSFFGRILVCNKLSNLKEYFFNQKITDIFGKENKLVVFTNKEHKLEQEVKQTVVKNISQILGKELINRPVRWSEIDIATQNALIKREDIKIQNITIKLSDFIEQALNVEICSDLFSYLQGTELNEMLRNKSIMISSILVKNIKPPTSEQTYISRKIYNRGTVSANFFGKFPPNSGNVFIIIHSMAQRQDTIYKNEIFTRINSLNEFCNVDVNECKSNIFFVEEPVQIVSNNSISFRLPVKHNISVHIFEYLELDTFSWVATTHGSFSVIENTLYQAAEQGASNEEAILINILKCKKPGDIIFISDEPGMGKTELLMKFAEKIMCRENLCVLLFEMRDILEKLESHASKEQVISSIADLLDSEFEKKILIYLLGSNSMKIEFELMIDGLDEVRNVSLAYDVLKVIKRDLPWIRVWVTGRDHLLESAREILGILGYKFLPFKTFDQISYLKKLWRESWKKHRSYELSNFPCDQTIEAFAQELLKKCISEKETHIAGIPLQCRMIGEIFEEKVLASDFSLDTISAFGLHTMYDEMLQKKFRIYWSEKQKLSENSGHDVAETQRERIHHFLVYLSMKLLFSEEEANKLSSYLLIPQKKRDIEKLKSDALKHGIVQSCNPLRFIHRTFAEYIVASFVTEEVVECQRNGDFLDSIDKIVKDVIWENILAPEKIISRIHLKNLITDFETLEDSPLSFMHKNVTRFLNMSLEPILSNVSGLLGKRGNVSTFYELVQMLELCEMFETMDIGYEEFNTKCIRIIILNISVKWKFINIAKLLFLLSDFPLYPFVFALYNEEYDIVKFVVDKMNFGPECWHTMQKYGGNKSEILHRVVHPSIHVPQGMLDRSILKNVSFMRYILEKDPSLIEGTDSKGQTPYLVAMKFALSLVAEVDQKGLRIATFDTRWNQILEIEHLVVQCEDSEEESLFEKKFDSIFKQLAVKSTCCYNTETVRYTPILAIKFLCMHYGLIIGNLAKFGADINAVDNDGNTDLHIIFSQHEFPHDLSWYVSFADFFLTLAYNRAHLNQFNKSGNTPLLCFLDNLCKIFKLQYYHKLDSRDTKYFRLIFDRFERSGTDFNARDSNNAETILHKAILRKYPTLFIQFLVHHKANILDKNNTGQSAIHLAVQNEHIPVKEFLLKANAECQHIKDNDGKTMRDYESNLSDQRTHQVATNSRPVQKALGRYSTRSFLK